MIVFLSGLSIRASSLELATTIVRNEHGTLENMNHFCRILLKCGEEGAEDYSALKLDDAEITPNLKDAAILHPEMGSSHIATDL
jgi:hypothetical protein